VDREGVSHGARGLARYVQADGTHGVFASRRSPIGTMSYTGIYKSRNVRAYCVSESIQSRRVCTASSINTRALRHSGARAV